jgi:hypothetical protein
MPPEIGESQAAHGESLAQRAGEMAKMDLDRVAAAPFGRTLADNLELARVS